MEPRNRFNALRFIFTLRKPNGRGVFYLLIFLSNIFLIQKRVLYLYQTKKINIMTNQEIKNLEKQFGEKRAELLKCEEKFSVLHSALAVAIQHTTEYLKDLEVRKNGVKADNNTLIERYIFTIDYEKKMLKKYEDMYNLIEEEDLVL